MDKKQYKKKLNDLRRQDWSNPGKTFAPESRVSLNSNWTKEEDVRYWLAQATHILKEHYGLSLRQIASLLEVSQSRLWSALQIYKISEFKTIEECTARLKKYHEQDH